MHAYTYTNHQGTKMTRVSARTARKLWSEGHDVTLCPCNLRPDSPWGTTCTIWQDEFEPWTTHDEHMRHYDYEVNYFTVFNCFNSETGRYPAFYVDAFLI